MTRAAYNAGVISKLNAEQLFEIARRIAETPPTSEELERRAMRWETAEPVRKAIERAFDGVVLGNGIGLFEAQAIDDYADDQTRAANRAKDENEDWRRISAEALNHCSSSLSFFDAEGMRFHLPAYIMAELRGEYRFDLDFHLCYFDDRMLTQFELLDDAQREAVRDYLLFLIEECDSEPDVAHIKHALESFWIDRGFRDGAVSGGN